VNLIHGAFYSHHQPDRLIHSLLDNLTWERVEVDMIWFAGPVFANVDNRLMALQLVEQDLTEAAMFTAEGETVQWNSALYRKPVLVPRGSFRPVTNATVDVLERALEQFLQEPELKNEPPVVLMEMTLRHLTLGDAIDHQDFLQRADMLRALGRDVFISNFLRLHRLAAYLGRYTDRPIGVALGAPRLPEVFDESFYNEIERGLLGGLGQLFKNPARLYVYPSLNFMKTAFSSNTFSRSFRSASTGGRSMLTVMLKIGWNSFWALSLVSGGLAGGSSARFEDELLLWGWQCLSDVRKFSGP
jgi:hypothetical protein